MRSRLTLAARIKALAQLGEKLRFLDGPEWQLVMEEAKARNGWFTLESQQLALNAIREDMLDEFKLDQWVKPYEGLAGKEPKKIGLILAGNIPAVGFHDVLSCLVSGHYALIKASEKDRVLIQHLLKLLVEIEPNFQYQFEFTEQLKSMEAVIATGSNNTGRYFHTYFDKYPNIIRNHRNSVAILTGQESDETLYTLGTDIFTYFGLGCRNVSKIFVPEGYNFGQLMEVLHQYNEIVLHHKYKNNFDYNIALYLLNRVQYINNGCLILLEDKRLASRIASLHYEYYKESSQLADRLKEDAGQIQCVVSLEPISNFDTLPPGQSQRPALTDYADGADTLAFLNAL